MYDQHLRAVSIGVDGSARSKAGGNVHIIRGLVVDRDGGGLVCSVQHRCVILLFKRDVGALRQRIVRVLAACGRSRARRIDLGSFGRQPQFQCDGARNEIPVPGKAADQILYHFLAACAREQQQRGGKAQRNSGGQPDAAPPPVVMFSAPSHGRHLPAFASIIRPSAREYDRKLAAGSGKIQIHVLHGQVGV